MESKAKHEAFNSAIPLNLENGYKLLTTQLLENGLHL